MVDELVPIIRAYYHASPDNVVGGSLHIVLDDGNVEDECVRWCAQYARENGDDEGARIADLLLQLTETQRRTLAAMSFWP